MAEGETDAATQIVRLLQDFSIASERFVDVTGDNNDMHRSDLHALNFIMRAQHEGHPTTSSELGRELGLTAAAMTALIDRLESSGHAVRERSDQDRRRVHITMTQKAAEDGWRMFGPLALRLAEVVRAYPPDEQRILIAFLTEAVTTVQGLTAERRRATV